MLHSTAVFSRESRLGKMLDEEGPQNDPAAGIRLSASAHIC